MYFHPGFAARNAITAIGLAEAGAFGSETILEGEAGLFAAYRRQAAPDSDRRCSRTARARSSPSTTSRSRPAISRRPPAQAALRVSHELASTEEIDRVIIRAPDAVDSLSRLRLHGALRNALQAKMSIHFGVAATLARGEIEEENYRTR